jgi:hypothetical protein
MLSDLFVGINFKVIDYKTSEASELIKKYTIASLPAFVIPEEVKKNVNFPKVADFFEEKSGKIFPKKELSGIFLFLERKEIPNRLDLFLNLYEETAPAVLTDLRAFSLKENINFNVYLVFPKKTKFTGYPQEEIKIAYAVKKVSPAKFLDYLTVRVSDITTKSWIESLEACGLDYKKIKAAADSKEVVRLISENDKIVKELDVTLGNVILVNNNRIFKVFQINPAELEKFFK